MAFWPEVLPWQRIITESLFNCKRKSRGAKTKILSVPEPSVALMGLLGLGMLLKRRKA